MTCVVWSTQSTFILLPDLCIHETLTFKYQPDPVVDRRPDFLSDSLQFVGKQTDRPQEDYVKYLTELDEKQFLHIRVFTNELKMIYVRISYF